MNKSLVIGLVCSLGISAVAGGVSGYYIKEKRIPTIEAVSEYTSDINIPKELQYLSFSKYDVDDYLVLSCSSLSATYLVNKETGKYSIILPYSVSTVERVNDNLIIYSGSKLVKYNLITKEVYNFVIPYNVGTLTFINIDENNVYMKNYISSKYYLLVFNINDGTCSSFSKEFSNSSVSKVIDFGENYLFNYGNDSSSSKYFEIVNKQEESLSYTSSSVRIDNESTYFVKNNVLFFMGSSGYLYSFSFETNTLTKVSTSSMLYCVFDICNNGFFITSGSSLSYEIYKSMYYYSFTDGTFLSLGSVHRFEYNNQVLFLSLGSTSKKASICYFNETENSLIPLIEAKSKPSSSSYHSYFTLKEFAGKIYFYECYGKYTLEAYVENDEIKFKELSLSEEITDNYIDLGNRKYIFSSSSSIYFYDFKNDVYKKISKCDIEDYEIKNNKVVIYGTDTVVYEFDINFSLVTKIGLWK